MSTYSPFQIFRIVFGGIGVLLGPMVMDGTPLHAGSEIRLAPAPAIGKVEVGLLVPAGTALPTSGGGIMPVGAVTALPTSGGSITPVGADTVLPASENNGTFAKEVGGGNSELLRTLPSLGQP